MLSYRLTYSPRPESWFDKANRRDFFIVCAPALTPAGDKPPHYIGSGEIVADFLELTFCRAGFVRGFPPPRE